jgi:ABC-type Na+ efflux pump permease subunit
MGPIFHRELRVQANSIGSFIQRLVYPTTFAVLLSTAWAIMTGAQRIQTIGDMARFGSAIFQLMAPLLLVLLLFAAAILGVSIVAQEKDRKTLILLLMTRLSNRELVVGKLFASLVPILVIWLVVLPIFMATILLGGVSVEQVLRTFLVAAASAFVAGSLGVVVAFWRERTFQSLALVILLLGAWIGLGEVLHGGWLGTRWLGFSCETWAAILTPFRALLANSTPFPHTDRGLPDILQGPGGFTTFAVVISWILVTVGIVRVRHWNTADEIRAVRIRGTVHATPHEAGAELNPAETAEEARLGHVDSRGRARAEIRSREVWDNPILWREVCTWAHGKKILVVRVAFLTLVVLAFLAIQRSPQMNAYDSTETTTISGVTRVFVPLVLVSMVMVNAIAVTSITMERDGRALDTLLATDLTPGEFIVGKLAGVASVGGIMLICPLLLAAYLWMRGNLSAENLAYLSIALITFSLFSIMLGIHCGMSYANSRNAIAVSLGTLFFLSLGVLACIFIMISFSESFQLQLAPFLAFILGGGLGMFVVLSAGNPSNAIAMASGIIPMATFYVITTMLLGQYLPAFLVTVGSYGFATAAMMIPKLRELDFATDRASGTDG